MPGENLPAPDAAPRVPLVASLAGVIWLSAALAWAGLVLAGLTVPERPPVAGSGPAARRAESAADFGRACGAGCWVAFATACAWHGYATATGRARDTALAGALSLLLAVPTLLFGVALAAAAGRAGAFRAALLAAGGIHIAMAVFGLALPGVLALLVRRDYLAFKQRAGAGAPPAEPPD